MGPLSTSRNGQDYTRGVVMREGKLAVSGAELRYDEAGQGSPMVLVHGSGVSGATWGGVLAPLAEAGFRVIAYDRRGYGGSIHRPVRDFRIHVADLLALLQQLDEPAHVVGWSSGSSAALAIAAERRPAAVRDGHRGTLARVVPCDAWNAPGHLARTAAPPAPSTRGGSPRLLPVGVRAQ
jgi:pimeloyl-ACP methyl ester carboxylesterase